MFDALPPLVMMPLIFAEFGQTCRSVSMPLKRAMSEVSALIPLSGVAECAERPLYSTRTPWAASPPRPMMFFVLGCIIRAKSTPSKAPRSTMKTLPPPPSSAGVPMTCTSPPVSSRTEASASPAPTLDAAMMLCPQACPSPLSASYSERKATTGPGFPLFFTARKAVSMPQKGASTVNPCFSSSSFCHAAARNSSKEVSGFAWMSWLRRSSSDFSSSARFRIRSFICTRPLSLVWHRGRGKNPASPVYAKR